MVKTEDIVERIKNVNSEKFPKGVKTISVSNVIGRLHEKFDKEGQAARCFEKYYDDQTSKYFHMTTEDILAQWEAKATESKKYGIMSDNYIEFRTQGHTEFERPDFLKLHNIDENEVRPLINKPLKNAFDGFDQFYNTLTGMNTPVSKYSYLTRELTLYYKVGDTIVKGRFDALFQHTFNGEPTQLILIDWKTNEEISTSSFGNKMMYGPCYNLQDCNFNHYSMQLQIYKKALLEIYHIEDFIGGNNPFAISTYIVQLGKLQEQNMKYFNMIPSKDLDNIVDDAILFAKDHPND